MIYLLYQGLYTLFASLVVALLLSLTFHEFGHAFTAKPFGDDTAERAGRLTLNPLAHIDIVGFLLVLFVGFGYAKPVPTNPQNVSYRGADLWVSLAGPAMNLVLAVVTWNFYLLMAGSGVHFFLTDTTSTFFLLLAKVNLLLMVFNLLPIGLITSSRTQFFELRGGNRFKFPQPAGGTRLPAASKTIQHSDHIHIAQQIDGGAVENGRIPPQARARMREFIDVVVFIRQFENDLLLVQHLSRLYPRQLYAPLRRSGRWRRIRLSCHRNQWQNAGTYE